MKFRSLSSLVASDVLIKALYVRIKNAFPSQCWEWQGAINCNGYGVLTIKRRQWMAHRLVYYIHHKKDPDQMLVCHTCDNRLCCNPAHLFLGSYKDNNQDCHNKGRNAKGDKHRSRTCPNSVKKGAAHHMAILDDAKVMLIRRKYSTGKFSQSELAKEFKVSQTSIGLVAQGKIWKHLPVIPYPRRTGRGQTGEKNHWAKLSDSNVEKIRRLATKGLTSKELAVRFNVSRGHINDIIAGRKRQH